MGGLALKKTHTRRYQKEEFELIIPDIQTKLRTLFTDAVPTKYYSQKDSFGDADFLVLMDKPVTVDIRQWLIETFDSKEVFKNGSVYSFEYKELQVDLIFTSSANWETSQVYYSYNDIHNMVGKIAHCFDCKWGHECLKYVYYTNGKKLGEIIITKNHRDALTFLGFDADRYDQGFKNLNEIFAYIINSKYFNPWLFDMENLNRVNRERDKKRTTYQSFLEVCKSYKNSGKNTYHYFYHDKKVYLGMIDASFPGFLKQYRNLEILEERKNKIKTLFNGNLVMEYFHISNHVLGKALKEFQTKMGGKDTLDNYILETNDTDLIMNKFSDITGLLPFINPWDLKK